MKITLNIRRNKFADLEIEAGNTKITEDVVDFSKDMIPYISGDLIEQFITIANDMSRFNGVSDVEFVKKIFDAFLNDSEQKEFIELITLNSPTQ